MIFQGHSIGSSHSQLCHSSLDCLSASHSPFSACSSVMDLTSSFSPLHEHMFNCKQRAQDRHGGRKKTSDSEVLVLCFIFGSYCVFGQFLNVQALHGYCPSYTPRTCSSSVILQPLWLLSRWSSLLEYHILKIPHSVCFPTSSAYEHKHSRTHGSSDIPLCTCPKPRLVCTAGRAASQGPVYTTGCNSPAKDLPSLRIPHLGS